MVVKSTSKIYTPLLLLMLFTFNACVTIQEIEGGPPDMEEPKIVKTFPDHEATNFRSQNITITFNKDIAANNIYNNLLIRPNPLHKEEKKPFKYKVYGRNLKLIFEKDALQENTTYYLDFTKAIRDTHEHLSPVDATLVFSTGNSIDRISIRGQIIDLLTNQPVKDAHIYLYRKTEEVDTTHKQESIESNATAAHTTNAHVQGIDASTDSLNQAIPKPSYSTISDDKGHFTIKYISPYQYYIRVKTGSDTGYTINYEKDSYGFLPDPIDLSMPQEGITIPVIQSDIRPLKLINKSRQPGCYELTFNKAIEKYTLKTSEQLHPSSVLYSQKINANTIRIYNTIGLLEHDVVDASLCIEDNIQDSYTFSLPVSFKEGRTSLEKENMTISFSSIYCNLTNNHFKETILFNKPIKMVNNDLIYLQDMNQRKMTIKAENLTWNSDRTELTIIKKWQKGDILPFNNKDSSSSDNDNNPIFTLCIEDGAFLSYDNKANERLTKDYSLPRQNQFGAISVNIDTTAQNFTIELLNRSYQIIESIQNQKNYHFTMLSLGDYHIRVLIPQQKDGVWSTGNIEKNIPPDPVIFYPLPVTVKAEEDTNPINLKF